MLRQSSWRATWGTWDFPLRCFSARSLLSFLPSCVFQVASFKAHYNVFGAPTLANTWSCQFICTIWLFLTREVLKSLWTQILLWPACWLESKWSLLRQSGQVSKSNISVLLSFVKRYSRPCFCFVLFSLSLGGQRTQQALGISLSRGYWATQRKQV